MKFDFCDQDIEDYEQEQLIQKWMDQSGNTDRIDLVHINRNGNPRNTFAKSQISLDQKISEDTDGTFADLVAGRSDGSSNLGGSIGQDPRDAAATLDGYLACLGFNEGESEWLIEKLSWWEKMRRTRLRRYQTDSESWELLTNFEE